ncbi:suppressor of RPS4-RLD 1 [Cucurbita pepo subsp. pepo]|uniref:suppressor of RPS4-RLD 1 n=1 Tax=Cucurbita pepo subsp. pepo TaxID=3664 RepID=UPI000C9DA3BF|nr:suppressor of RPS4-RLD 1 [Cucurbita pepo subsp. pepo]
MAPAISERVELAKFCRSKDWSKAIRVLDSLITKSCTVQDICNRAFCYSQLELHKHVIKDCDRALQLDPSLLQAYVLKGRAYFSLGKKGDALSVWESGYQYALCQSADLKQLLELEDLLTKEKQDKNNVENGEVESGFSTVVLESEVTPANRKLSETNNNEDKLMEHPDFYMNPSDASEVCSRSSDNLSIFEGGSEEIGQNSNINCESNGRSDYDDASKLHDLRSDISEFSNIQGNISDEAKRTKKFPVAKVSKTKSIRVDFRLSRGIAEVNEGKYAIAISIFDQILKEDPSYPEALIGRGTAYAFQRELDAAIGDFTKALESNPFAGEAWKRRGQARAALGASAEAIEDLTKALELEPNSADILHERGIVNFKFKDFYAAVEDLSECLKVDGCNTSAYTYLGLALSSIGDYKGAEEAHLKSIQLDRNFLEAWGHLIQFYQDLANTTKALECLHQVLQMDSTFVKAYHLCGLLYHGIGEHRKAIKELSIGLNIENSNIECLYLRASCYHAIGEYGLAVKDYDATLDLDLDSMDKFMLQCLAFYQKEIALYTASKSNSDFCWFSIDGDIDPLFKEYWFKRLHPKDVCEKVFRQPPIREPLKKGRVRKQDHGMTKQKISLLLAADNIGRKIQYDCPGFLSNRRQHRMAGLAAIDVAQRISRTWRSLQAEWKCSNKNTTKYGKRARRRERPSISSQNRGGAGCSTSGFSETSSSSSHLEDRLPGHNFISWQDIYSLAVKWRQISEPCDPVLWINKLSEEFNSGFGSHTSMILGQAKVVRYFPNFERTLEAAKTVIKHKSFVYNKSDMMVDLSGDGKLQDIMEAKSCSDLYKVVGEDFWLATWCNSTAFEGKQLEGTRITLAKTGERGFDFAIRSPCTASRWEEFDAEMTTAWETICNAYCGENYGSMDFSTLESVRDAILRMSYYWYNFMPLSRGSAAVGFVVLLGLLLAANMEFCGNIPRGLQVDWEALLNFDPNCFVDSVKSWLYPSLKMTTSWKEFPDVASTFKTTGSVVSALSSYDD